MKKYTVLMIDLKKSKAYSLKDRNFLQNQIMDIIKALNDIFHTSTEKKVEFSAGDEIQGLFSSSAAAYLYLRIFSMLIFPVKIHAGIGVGEWTVVMNNASTTAQDGSAYHNAREAINSARNSLEYSRLFFSKAKDDFIINSLLAAELLVSSKQSVYQNELMLVSEILYPLTKENIIDSKKIPNLLKFINHENLLHLQKNIKNKFLSKPIEIDNEEFFITIGKKRGLSTQLSEYLGISRQSVEKTIKTASIYELRNMAVTILKTMKI
ncbi:MAG: SatD family protein [Fusobacterium sp.]|uniref:SatD family protein n=1 Tax=Fusobacterium sp. TaxID=68766 RepID=UPI0026DC02B3|nr:SatD family protein [Fusobacterium sp.]MDO4690662.1 SatD family protein [Fusobacterium sp.]